MKSGNQLKTIQVVEPELDKATPVLQEVLRETQRIHAEVIVIRATQLVYAKEIATLKVKTGLWNAFVGAVVAFFAVYF